MTIWLVAIIRGPDCFKEEPGMSREPPAGPHVLCDVNSHTSGCLMFLYLRTGRKLALLTDEAGSGRRELEAAADDENV